MVRNKLHLLGSTRPDREGPYVDGQSRPATHLAGANQQDHTALNGSNRLDMANVPVGQNGQVLGRTNLLLGNWTTNVHNFNSTNVTQSVFVTASGPQWFYRLNFPYSWTWP